MRRVFVSAASNARKWVQGETLLMRRVLVSAANTARNGRRAKPRPFKRRELVLAANTARKWVQGEALPGKE